MKAYTFALGKLMDGIVTTHDASLQQNVVFLGDEFGKKSRCVKVSMDSTNPAVRKNGVIKFAHPRIIRDKFVVLAEPIRGDNSALIRVNTSGLSSESSGMGRWIPSDGNPQVKARANGSRPSGTIYCDDLVTLSPGDSIIVYPEGEKSGFEITNVRGTVRCAREKDHEK